MRIKNKITELKKVKFATASLKKEQMIEKMNDFKTLNRRLCTTKLSESL